jgi:hypothetical protein
MDLYKCKAIWIPIKPFFDMYQPSSSGGIGPSMTKSPEPNPLPPTDA